MDANRYTEFLTFFFPNLYFLCKSQNHSEQEAPEESKPVLKAGSLWIQTMLQLPRLSSQWTPFPTPRQNLASKHLWPSSLLSHRSGKSIAVYSLQPPHSCWGAAVRSPESLPFSKLTHPPFPQPFLTGACLNPKHLVGSSLDSLKFIIITLES